LLTKGEIVADIKIVVIYPRPTDIDEFEKRYKEEHVPMAAEKLAGSTKFVATRFVDGPQGPPQFHRMAEIYFHSLAALKACADSQGGKETVAHAVAISTGGPPIMMIAEEDSSPFQDRG